jgi:hypothetical protein
MNQFGSQMTMGAQNQTAFGTTQPMSLPFGQQQMAPQPMGLALAPQQQMGYGQ